MAWQSTGVGGVLAGRAGTESAAAFPVLAGEVALQLDVPELVHRADPQEHTAVFVCVLV